MRRPVLLLLATIAVAGAAFAPAARADDQWLPHPAHATWTWSWTDSVYSKTPTLEKVTVKSRAGKTFSLAWTTAGLKQADGAQTSTGSVDFQETDLGIVNTNWTSGPPPPVFPILCASAQSCGNSLASAYYNVIWGARNPVLAEPLLKGVAWAGTGGSRNDVTSTTVYLGNEKVKVPAFTSPVVAAKVRSQVTQAGAIGDPYGSGTRTTWWVYGVGPVKVEFDHAGGAGAPVTISQLESTNLKPLPTPTNIDYFPFHKGRTLSYRWTNAKHLKTPEVTKLKIDAVVNNTARFTIVSTKGPIKAKGSYGFSKRVGGVTNLWGNTASASLKPLPPLGGRARFSSPLDLMDYGLNPILTAYPASGQSWATSRASSEFKTYGVTGSTRVLGTQRVTVPAGTFDALAVQSTLSQPGHPFGSGTRTCWFAEGKGLVKLEFRHADGSVSDVVLLR
ncbi:MAG TPA: hypothetical protein VI408_05340 [Gaiellaceae bacterium]